MQACKAIATQACRAAENGPEFIERVAARDRPAACRSSPRGRRPSCSVAGCLNLVDRSAEAALVVDVGGGSTELSWVDLKGGGLEPELARSPPQRCRSRPGASIPIGVVTLAERFPEGETATEGWFRAMVDDGEDRTRRPFRRRRSGLREAVRRRPGPPGRHLGRDHQPGRHAPGPAPL